jgi:TatD DNase family protein
MLGEYPENVYAVVGLHPSHTYDNPYLDENERAFTVEREEFDYEAYKQLAQNPRVVGIGECGLDFFRIGDPNDPNNHTNVTNIKELQKVAFLEQIRLALELDKTLVIHCRPSKGTDDAYDDVLEILLRIKDQGLGMIRFEVHSFTGNLETAKKFLSLGGYIGLNGIVTFDKTGVMEEVVKGVPLDRIVLETDSPYLAPTPFRGKRNEPSFVVEVAKKIATLKGVTLEEVEIQTTENAKRLFKLNF